jgi:hypothetical protein
MRRTPKESFAKIWVITGHKRMSNPLGAFLPILMFVLVSLGHWTLSDKIALFASLSALAQFLALVGTIAITRNYGRKQLRAYVTLYESELIFYDDGTTEAVLRFRNSGQTPAYAFEGARASGFTPYPVDPAAQPQLGSLKKSSTVIGSGATYCVRERIRHTNVPSRDLLMPMLSTPNFAFCVRSYHTYRDIFGNKQYLKTQQIVGGLPGVERKDGKPLSIGVPGDLVLTLFYDSEGNDAS